MEDELILTLVINYLSLFSETETKKAMMMILDKLQKIKIKIFYYRRLKFMRNPLKFIHETIKNA